MGVSGAEFDASERAQLREVIRTVNGNGKAGLNDRVRRIEWLLYVVLGAIALAALDGRIRYHSPQEITVPSAGGSP